MNDESCGRFSSEKGTSAHVKLCGLFQGLQAPGSLASHETWLDTAVTSPSMAEKTSHYYLSLLQLKTSAPVVPTLQVSCVL